MPITVTLHVFRGGLELVPNLCMFCARPLKDEDFQSFTMQIGHGRRSMDLPICHQDRSSATVKYPDGRSQLLDAVADANVPFVPGAGALPMALILGTIMAAKLARNLQRHQESIETTFTFKGVHNKFVAELEHLRNLSDREYDEMMAKANEKFVAQIHANAPVISDPEKRRQLEEEQAVDAAMFGMEQTTGAGEMSVEVTRSNRNKLLMVVAMVFLASMTLAMCLGAGAIAYSVWGKKTPTEDIAKDKPPPPKEQKARIKEVDAVQNTLRLLIGDGKYKTFPITEQTELFDAAGQRLKLNVLEAHKDADVLILQTEDREGLQWLKLAAK